MRLPSNFRRGRLDFGTSAGGEPHFSAGFGQADGTGAPDAAPSPGDEGSTAVEPETLGEAQGTLDAGSGRAGLPVVKSVCRPCNWECSPL